MIFEKKPAKVFHGTGYRFKVIIYGLDLNDKIQKRAYEAPRSLLKTKERSKPFII